MAAGYLYVLTNRAYGANVVKVGLTTRSPDVRAREIYSGSTGVPLQFDIAVAYSVADCARAEKLAHRRLRAFRLSNRREFFRVTPSVAASVAHQACKQINSELAAAEPTLLAFPAAKQATAETSVQSAAEHEASTDRLIIEAPIGRLRESPVGTSTLTPEQIDRAEVLHALLTQINPVTREQWLESFTRDEHPERELRIWESIAKAYLTLEHADDATEGYRSEAFNLLLSRSWYSTEEVLARAELKHFSRTNAKRLLQAYELRPKPIVVEHG
ncbi:GIY-YIG nuclease family protein [Laribacter hongkongensis]|uniref:GIY-YIG nuclease family protein n=1 Tax=Laribacter hongkongensis TaxID=168471 RepID=UPI00282A18FE|nr:GIY-YIG nuclease family protein [Laribacter hongkongensis]MCG9009048.1 GIY-YIG nuclease family protein [Laribacter hongkongensis]MCG9021461.1 GIY-YIG nuclease family protein [Laribacter hongkongensis]MCG9046509.1 GIY-YIG nuclease family protein [Laribacter hongkongensis]MCG9072667.1 GIY-YIG nuclease family protein [Laribacter hongkongensis]